MMKKRISLILVLLLFLSVAFPSLASGSDQYYYSVPVEYSDNVGHQELLDIMIRGSNVYVSAKMISERLGYTFNESGDGLVIYNRDTTSFLPFSVTKFKYNSTQVSHMLFNNMIDTYIAPFAPIKNSEGSWIPLEYSLFLINSGLMITSDALLIDMPRKNIVDYFYDVAKNNSMYSFDFASDFRYTDENIRVLGGSSHLVNVFNGLLEFDGASWVALFQQFVGSMSSYDRKYGKNLALLLCTESDKELQESIKKVNMMVDILDNKGKLGTMLSNTSLSLDKQVGSLYKECEDLLETISSSNSSLVSYNKSYQALERALDKQTWFSSTGATILDIQRGTSEAVGNTFTILNIGTRIMEVVGYTEEFYNQDSFSVAALSHYMETVNNGSELPRAMKKSMIDYSDALLNNVGYYTSKRFLENVNKWIIDDNYEALSVTMGTPATAILLAWNIASNTIPYLSNSLSSADNFELALYSLIFQADSFLNYLRERDYTFSDPINITTDNLYESAQYCYIYLKSCYIAREAALASLASTSDLKKEDMQPLIDYQNKINAEIAKILVALKDADKTNANYCFGFLPSENESYLDNYDDDKLIHWIKGLNSILSTELVTDAYANDCTYTTSVFNYETERSEQQAVKCVFRIPRINLSSDDVEVINSEIYNFLFPLIEESVNEIQKYGQPESCDEASYSWSVYSNILSLVVKCFLSPNASGAYKYMVFNISTLSGKKVSNNDLISSAGFSQEDFIGTAREALGSAYFVGKESMIESGCYDSFFITQFENTISDSNIERCIPFFNDDGQLCVIAAIYSLAAADYYFHEINLEQIDTNSAYEKYIGR